MKDKYSSLKRELTAIAKVVKAFPDDLHSKVFDLLIATFADSEIPVLAQNIENPGGLGHSSKKEIPGIASLDEKGKFHFTVRDPKANGQSDGVRRLTYMAIRSYLLLNKNETSVSRKKIINPILSDWRVYDGNARNWLAHDKGIVRDGGAFSLDKHATDEADQFIKDVLDSKLTGSWKPGSTPRKKANAKEKGK